MRTRHHFGRILVLLAMAVSVFALCDSGAAVRNYAHVPGGHHRQFPSHRIHRASSRGRRSQGWEAPELSGADQAHATVYATPQAAVAPLKRVPKRKTGAARVLLTELLPQRTVEHRQLQAAAPVRYRPAPLTPWLVRGPPLA